MQWAKLLGGGQSWWYLTNSTGKVLLAKHERDMTKEMWDLTKQNESDVLSRIQRYS